MKRKMVLTLVVGLGLGAVLAMRVLLSVGAHAEPLAVSAEAASPQSSGGDSKGGAFVISTAAYARENPVIAYNPISDTYLIVWADGESGQRNIYGQIHSVQGVPQGEVFPISTADDDQLTPAVAYNVALNQYLAVWRDERSGGSRGYTYGQRISADGSLLDNPGTSNDESDPGVNFPISLAFDRMNHPAISSNDVDEYLVLWNDYGEIHGQRVGGDGSLLDNSGTPDDESDPGVDFFVSAGAYDPAVAYSADAGEYLVVYVQSGHYSHIYGQRMLDNGSLQNPVFSISVADHYKAKPSVAYNPDSQEYLVVWQENYVAESWRLENEISGQRVGIDGSLLDNPGTPDVDESNPAVSFLICSAEGFQGHPDLAYITDTSLGQYLVVWQDDRHGTTSGIDIYGQRVGGDGTLAEQGDFAVSSAIGDQELPAIAYSSSSHQYLAVWQDDRQGAINHIYGQRIWWPGLPLGHNFAIGAPSADQERPAVAYNSEDREYLVVWSDERNGDADIYGQFYDRDGVPQGENFAVHEGVGNQIDPDAVYNSAEEQYLVVWNDLESLAIEGQLLSSRGAPLFLPIGIASNDGYPNYPIAAYNASDNNYLVAFNMWNSPISAIYGRQVFTDGTVSASSTAINQDSVAYSKYNLDLTYSPSENEFLVVWEDSRASNYDIYAQRVDATGVPTDSVIVIADGMGDQALPAISHNFEENEYLVVWQDDHGTETDADIYAQRVSMSGTLVGGHVLVPTTNISASQEYPDVVYVSGLDRYRIVWQDNRDSATLGWDIRGQWLASNGSYVGTLDAPIIRYPGDQSYSAIAYAPGQERALVVWQDGRSGTDADIYGSFGALDLNPPVARFTRNPGVFRPVGVPFAFNAWPSLDDTTLRGSLEVRWDLDGDGSWDDPSFSYNKYVTHTFSTPGVHTVTLQVRDEVLLTDTLSLPVFAYTTTMTLRSAGVAEASVPTASLVISPTFHIAGDTFTFDGTGSTGGGALLARWDWENDGLFDTGFGAVLTATHTYIVAGDYTVRLEVRDSVSGLSDIDLHNVTVQAGEPVSLTVMPDEAAVVGADTFRFRATAWDSYGNKMYNPAVTWTMIISQAGAIDASGLFTAGVQAGTYPDAIVVGNGLLTETVSVTVFWPHRVYLPLVVRGQDGQTR
jgi:PKD repeat protein